MDILISGGSGFLGRAFTQWIQQYINDTAHQLAIQKLADTNQANRPSQKPIRITWLSRDTAQPHQADVSMMDYDELALTQQPFDVVINLAGAGIADKRWTDQRKQLLFESRLKPTQALLDYITRIPVKPKLFISGSAIGWYGAHGNTALDESYQPPPVAPTNGANGEDFAHVLCDRWEIEASDAKALGVDVVLIRTGVVIHPQGGMMARLIPPFKMGVGGKLGDGEQIMSWVSRDDWVRAVWFIIQNHLKRSHEVTDSRKATIYNLTAPNPVSNAAFTKAVGEWLNRPTFMTLPAWLLKLMFGEMSTLLIDGQKVLPTHLLEAGFEFKHTHLQQALAVEG